MILRAQAGAVLDSGKAGTHEQDTVDAALIDGALAAPWYVLRFPPALEARFRADGKCDRLHYQRRVGLVGLALVLAFIPTDAEMVPDVFQAGLAMYAASSVVGLLLLSLLRPRTPDWLADLAILLYTFPVTIAQTIMFSTTHSPDKAAYLNSLPVSIMFANICLQQRFGWAVASTLGLLAILMTGLSTGGISIPTLHAQTSILISAGVLTLIIAHRLEWQNRRAYLFSSRDALSHARLVELAERDGLTGLANRHAIDAHLERSWAVCTAAAEPLTVIMLDVDWFKRFNDTYGHPAGDACLRAIAGTLDEIVRKKGDVAGRYGGEEFILILPGADTIAGHGVAERACAAVEALQIPHALGSPGGFVTASLGVACCSPAHGGDIAAILHAADAALYAAKHAGRAQVACADMAG